MRRTLAASVISVIAGIGLAIGGAAGTALARTGPAFRSPEQAGYAVSGARFTGVEAWVRLPPAARFAREVGQLGVSAQVMTSRLVIDLKATACSTTTCRPGGRPVMRSYRVQVSVYNRSSHALICSTAASGSRECPNVPSSFRNYRVRPGKKVQLYIIYAPPWRFLFLSVGDAQYNLPVSRHSAFTQANLGVEFGATPWSSVPFRAPRTPIAITTFGRPKPPPYWAEVITANGSSGGIAGWWAHHAVTMTRNGRPGGAPEARPGVLSDHGYRFTVYLEP
ncbi:MAG: hypothetical protein ACYCVZ_20125 [Streptosporangiaceae bacterium]